MSSELIRRLYEESQDNPDSLHWQAAQELQKSQERLVELEETGTKMFWAIRTSSSRDDRANDAADEWILAMGTEDHSLLTSLKKQLKTMCDVWKTVCQANGWDENHMVQYQESLELLNQLEQGPYG